MWEQQLCGIKISKKHIENLPTDVKAVNVAHYYAEIKARESGKINKMLQRSFIKPAQFE